MDETLVTVIILSFNRKDELRNTLHKVFDQNYNNIEVIVVDNASTDGTPEMISKEFPDVILISLQKNIGIAGWNEGLKISKGQYLLVLDDDAFPEYGSIEKAISVLNSDKNIACISFNMINSNTDEFYETNFLPGNKDKKVYYPVFIGCAFMLKSDRVPKFFKFPVDYFIYQHELPMSAEIIINQKKICFVPDIIAYHNFKNTDYYNNLSDRQVFQNNLKYIIRYLPLLLFIFYVTQQLIFYFTRSIRRGWFKEYVKIVKNMQVMKYLNCTRINYGYFLELRKLHLFNYRMLSKLRI